MKNEQNNDDIGLHLDFLDRIGEELEINPLNEEQKNQVKNSVVRDKLRKLDRDLKKKNTLTTRTIFKKNNRMISVRSKKVTDMKYKINQNLNN
jgi:hypothetical protein